MNLRELHLKRFCELLIFDRGIHGVQTARHAGEATLFSPMPHTVGIYLRFPPLTIISVTSSRAMSSLA